jgi:hypothetical protein
METVRHLHRHIARNVPEAFPRSDSKNPSPQLSLLQSVFILQRLQKYLHDLQVINAWVATEPICLELYQLALGES